jgi:hypothetical protein
MQTWSGSVAPLTSGEPNILDLVVHTGRESRWGGFGDVDWTVLHHEMLCALIWLKAGYPPEGVCHVINHDKHEGYTGDIPSPVKALLGEGIVKLEKDLDARIFKSLNMPALSSDNAYRVKVCDKVALIIEASLFGPPGAGAPCLHSATLENIDPEYRAEVGAVLARVMPDLDKVVAARRGR